MAEPSVFVIGAQKCGTTTVADILAAQPEIFVPSIKETYFFCDEALWAKGLDWYRGEFYSPSATGQKRIFCDATPFYLASRDAIDRLAAYANADTRFIAVLRDPVSRAYSAYWHQRRLGNEPLSFEDALDAEPERIARARATGARWWRHAYVEVGRYAVQLAHAHDRLGRDRMLVLTRADLSDVGALQERLRRHIDLRPIEGSLDAPVRSNSAAMPRSQTLHRMITGRNPLKSVARAMLPRELRTRIGRRILAGNLQPARYPPMQPETRARLEAVFASDIAALEALGVAGADTLTSAG